MHESFVEVSWEPEGDGTGRLSVVAVADDYSGLGSAWFDVDKVASFAQRLEAYPLPSIEAIALTGGLAGQELVGIRVAPVGVKGQIRVWVHLSTPQWEWPVTRPESVHDVRLEVLTTYGHLGRFASELGGAGWGKSLTARLNGEAMR